MMSLSERYSKLYTEEKLVDCSFQIEGNTVKCHKLILSTVSPVFEAMFYGAIRETKPFNIEILDISYETFDLMISYIYSNDLQFTDQSMETSLELLYSANKYMLDDLAGICLKGIKSKLRYSNILSILEFSIDLNLSALTEICDNFMAQCCLTAGGAGKFFTIFKSNCYHHVTTQCIQHILKVQKSSEYLSNMLEKWLQHENEISCSTSMTTTNKQIFDEFNNQNNTSQQLTKNNPNRIRDDDCRELYLQRLAYRACAPFLVAEYQNTFEIAVKPKCYLILTGVVINGRLMPKKLTWRPNEGIAVNQLTYLENLTFEIVSRGHCELEFNEYIRDQMQIFNNDCTIKLKKEMILIPDEEYFMRITWNRNGFGAEYPCSFYGMDTNEMEFHNLDNSSSTGSLFKGFKFIKLT